MHVIRRPESRKRVTEQNKLAKRLRRQVGAAIADFKLIEAGDRVMVCLSGGKDSYGLLDTLLALRAKAPVPFELIAVHLDQGQPGYDGTPLEVWLREQGYAHRIVREDTYRVVTKVIPEGQTYCSLCSRLRRGILYNTAQSLGCTKIALGHHRDDAIETLMLNMMFNGSLSAMPAKLISDDGRNTVIRPLLYSSERDIAAYSEHLDFPIIPCNLCGSQEKLWRQQVKQMLDEIEKRAPQVRESMLAALKNVRSSHLLGAS